MIERLANTLDAVAGPGNADVLGRESFDERGRGRRAFSTLGAWGADTNAQSYQLFDSRGCPPGSTLRPR